MDGNTHYNAAAIHRPQLVTEESANEHYLAEQGITDETMQFSALNRVAEATLALAYEQRTANLIAVGQLIVAIDGPTVNMKGALDLIESRLGLEA